MAEFSILRYIRNTHHGGILSYESKIIHHSAHCFACRTLHWLHRINTGKELTFDDTIQTYSTYENAAYYAAGSSIYQAEEVHAVRVYWDRR